MALFGFPFFGLYGGWIYLRYYQPRPDGTGVGDPGDHISFVSFFPAVAEPLLSPMAGAYTRPLFSSTRALCMG